MRDPVEIEYDEVVHETEEATLYNIQGERVWLPKSVIEDDGDGLLTVPSWLAEQKELE